MVFFPTRYTIYIILYHFYMLLFISFFRPFKKSTSPRPRTIYHNLCQSQVLYVVSRSSWHQAQSVESFFCHFFISFSHFLYFTPWTCGRAKTFPRSMEILAAKVEKKYVKRASPSKSLHYISLLQYLVSWWFSCCRRTDTNLKMIDCPETLAGFKKLF